MVLRKGKTVKLCAEYNPGPCGECGQDGQEIVEGVFLCEKCYIGPVGRKIADDTFNAAARETLVDMGLDAADVAKMSNKEVNEHGIKQMAALLLVDMGVDAAKVAKMNDEEIGKLGSMLSMGASRN